MGDIIFGDRTPQQVYDELEGVLKKTSESNRVDDVVKDLELLVGDEKLTHQAIVLIKNISIMPTGMPKSFQPFSDDEMVKVIEVVKKVGSKADVEEFSATVAFRALVKPPGNERAESVIQQLQEEGNEEFHRTVDLLITKKIAPYHNQSLAFTEAEVVLISPHVKKQQTFVGKLISAPTNYIKGLWSSSSKKIDTNRT